MGVCVCRNQVFACFFEDFCDLLEPSARAGGPGTELTVWALWSSVSFGVSLFKTTPGASHPCCPSCLGFSCPMVFWPVQ